MRAAPIEKQPALRGQCLTALAKWDKEEIITEYAEKHGLPYVIVRPGVYMAVGTSRYTDA